MDGAAAATAAPPAGGGGGLAPNGTRVVRPWDGQPDNGGTFKCHIYSGRKENHVMTRVGKQRGKKRKRETRKSYIRESDNIGEDCGRQRYTEQINLGGRQRRD